MTQVQKRADDPWRKSRLAARLLRRKLGRPLQPRERELAQWLQADPEVTNRLIQQGIYFLGGAALKDEIDQKLVDR